jgi:2-isopropylmalate synthase
MKKIDIYDTTLRDGSQQVGISFSVHDKLAIVRRLDPLGMYVEGGYPGSNPKDREFFELLRQDPLKHSKLVAFGKTCLKSPQEDEELAYLLEAHTEFVTIVGKSSRYQVEDILRISAEENLRMIRETCSFLAGQGRQVFFDAEHFFDGFCQDPEYSLECIRAAARGGACRIVLCDTNGGSLPDSIASGVKAAKRAVAAPIGIHCHNDGDLAVANSLSAVDAGATQVQVTVNGYGERCGNADMASVVVNLQLKKGHQCFSDAGLRGLTKLARYVAEMANLPLGHSKPIVGKGAFCDKAGLHASASARAELSYKHIDPSVVGNVSSTAVSELAGRSNILLKVQEFGLPMSEKEIFQVLGKVEDLENQGFQFDVADASLFLLMLRFKDGYSAPFRVIYSDIRSQAIGNEDSTHSANVKIELNNGKHDVFYEAAEGDGPVNALDLALRKALSLPYPCIANVILTDYKVRVLDGGKGSAKSVRILIDFSDGTAEWTTVGCATSLTEASKMSLVEGLEYAIVRAQ